MRRLALPRRILSGKKTERGSEMSDLASAAPSAPANNNPDVSDPTAVIDEELLCKEVKKYPLLYENAYTDFVKRMVKMDNWNKVCQSLFKQWNEFSVTKKKDTLKLVQNTWQQQMENFFKNYYKRAQKHPKAKRSKTHMDSMTFLIPPIVASDVDEGACSSNTNTGAAQFHIADEMPMDMPLQPELEIPQVNIPDNPPVPSTSATRAGEYARTYEVHKPFYIPMMDIGVPVQANSNPNIHFALMLLPLLNRLNQNALYNAWPEILNTIKNAECPKRLEILQQELYDPAVKTQENVEFSGVSTAEVPPEEEAVQENPTYPSSYGRPTNPDGEIMYPETDHEDLDEN